MSRMFAALLAAALLASAAEPARAQVGELERAAIGGAVGVAGGAVVTLGVVVARARLHRQYLDSAEDLIHWQSIPMIAAPAAGVLFGLAGEEALIGSIIGSTTGMVAGAAVGGGLGWLGSTQQEWPWAGAVMGAALGMTAGGIFGGLRGWAGAEDPGIEFPNFMRIGISVPVR